MESKIETPVDIVEVKIAENNDTNQTVEVVKKKRGRPRKHPPPEPKPPTEDGDEPKEPKKRGRPKKSEQLPKPIKNTKKKEVGEEYMRKELLENQKILIILGIIIRI